MTKKILITGANGQLGNEVQNQFANCTEYKIFATDVHQLDITNREAVNNFVETNAIDYIVNCAAYTAVDKAEDEKELCAKINVDAVENLAYAAKKHNAKIIQVSTDYVFSGNNYIPYKESDTTDPISTYGKTKLEGENKLIEILEDSLIIRTSWLYSSFGNNFVKTMLRLGREKEELNVVADQVGTPTYARDLAIAIKTAIENKSWMGGIYHFSNEGVISWYDFTKAIHRIAGIDTCKVSPIESKDYPTKAVRPFYSVLNKNKIKTTFNITIPYWEDSLKECINIIEQQTR